MTRRRVVVVGGGITGLTTAYRLSAAGADIDITLLEAGNRLGGMIKTASFAGATIDEGTDSFLAQVPEAVELCAELGINDRLISPAVNGANVYARGKMRPVPEAMALGVPTSLFELLGSGIVSFKGALRAGLDLVKPDDWPGQDESVGDLISRRLGSEVSDYLVDPLIGALTASDTRTLSARMATPTIAHVARRNRSLIKGMRASRHRAEPPSSGPVFYGFAGGMTVLVDRLHRALAQADVRTATPAIRIGPRDDHYVVETGSGPITADAVVLACSASASAALISDASPTAADQLASIEYASVAVVNVSLRADSIGAELDGSGVLIPRPEGLLTSSISWSHLKWPHWVADDGRALLRITAGRHNDTRAMALDDDELVDSVMAEAAKVLDIDGPILEWRVARWANAIPQYAPGHRDRVTAIEGTLRRDTPGVFVTGASFRGVGVPACIAQASSAAQAAVDSLGVGP